MSRRRIRHFARMVRRCPSKLCPEVPMKVALIPGGERAQNRYRWKAVGVPKMERLAVEEGARRTTYLREQRTDLMS
ncbi:MAG: hypothetical protein LQ337_006060 [Flavoplaca oasis]|nr:MAG: hypothetical protein LQ337_006060 [Flavoplaca oasis]